MAGLPTAAVLNSSGIRTPLYQHSTGDTYVTAALQMLRRCPTAYNTLFFSKQNLDTIQGAMRDRIRNKLGYVIDRQDDDALCVIMRGVFVNWGREPPCDRPDVVAGAVAVLNKVVLSLALPQVASGVVAYVNYLRDASQLPEPIPLPVATSTAGTKNLPIFSGI